MVIIHVTSTLAGFLPEMREAAHSLDPFSSSQPWTLPSCPSGYQAQLAAATASFPQSFLKQEAAQCWNQWDVLPRLSRLPRNGRCPTWHCLHVRQSRKWLPSEFFCKLYRSESLKKSLYLYFIPHSFECFPFTPLASFQP